jgi:beta-glucosidase-like glycosyl hydrolase
MHAWAPPLPSMMCSYNSVNGIPTCLSKVLKKARELWTGQTPWGGYITSDSDSVSDAVHTHHYTGDAGNASCTTAHHILR